MSKAICLKCDGSGTLDNEVCPACGGTGNVNVKRSSRLIRVDLEVSNNCQTCQFRDYDTCILFNDKVFDRVPLAECEESTLEEDEV